MFKSQTLERKSCGRHFQTVRLVVFFLAACLASSAQSSANGSLESYADAIRQSRIGDRISAMEHFLSVSGTGSLKIDALEVLAWDYRQMGDPASSRSRAQQLLAIDPQNALALAILSENDGQTSIGPSRNVSETQFALAQRGLAALAQLRQPEGMIPANFSFIRQQVSGVLHGIAGMGYLDRRDYENAREHLRQALAADPNNGRYTYGLALALLLTKHPDAADGYWYLARAVNLNQGTPSGQQISAYARSMYKEDGGSDANWDKFLQVTATAPSQTVVASNKSVAPATSNAAPSSVQTTSATATVATIKPTAAAAPATVASAGTSTVRSLHPELAAPPENTAAAKPAPARKNPGLMAPNAPVSLGILVQTQLLGDTNRHAIIEALTGMVRKLRPDDEAFIMAFSNQLDFEQDLTANDTLLEEAMAELKPKSGAALIDGVEFAIGHLKRIGKNSNRVLLIFSDGRNDTSKTASAPLSTQVHDVRIDCIGVDVEGTAERNLLQNLASYSGGRASFASNPQQLRAVTSQVAQTIGIESQ